MKSYSKKFFYKDLELVYCKEENCFYKVVESELIKLELSEEQVEKGKEFMFKNKIIYSDNIQYRNDLVKAYEIMKNIDYECSNKIILLITKSY